MPNGGSHSSDSDFVPLHCVVQFNARCPSPVPGLGQLPVAAAAGDADVTGEDSGVRSDSPLSRGGGHREGEADGEVAISGVGGAKGKGKGKARNKKCKAACKFESSDEVLDEAVSSWYEKQDELFRNLRDASNELVEGLMARASHMLIEPVVTGPDFYGKMSVLPAFAGKRANRELWKRYIHRKRKGYEESDEGKRKARIQKGATMVDH